jgi:hypothetical protein
MLNPSILVSCESGLQTKKVHILAHKSRYWFTILRTKLHNPAHEGSQSCADDIRMSQGINDLYAKNVPNKMFIKVLNNFNERKLTQKFWDFWAVSLPVVYTY